MSTENKTEHVVPQSHSTAGLGDCHAELLEIHNIIMCIAECPPIKDTDTYTVRGVKEMAQRLNVGEIRARLGGVQIDDTPGGDNLAIALCSYYSSHMNRPEEGQETECGWGEWVEARCDEALDRIAASLTPNVIAQGARTTEP